MNVTLPIVDRADFVRQLVRSSGGRIFGCAAIKRDGTLRLFNAKSAGDTFTAQQLTHNRLVVLECNATQAAGFPSYRTIALDKVISLQVNGSLFTLHGA